MPKIKQMNTRQLNNLINNAQGILEARRDDLEYREIRKTKGAGKNKIETDEIDFLMVELKGHESAKFTRLAEKYFEANEALQQAQVERDALNEEMKELSAPLWDTKDKVEQRIVATVSYGFMLTAKTPPSEKTEVDYEGVVNDLSEALNIQTELLEEIIEKNKKIKETKGAPEKLREPSQKHKKWMKQAGVGKRQIEESISEDIKNKLSSWFTSFSSLVDKYLNTVDNMLARVEKELA